MVHDRWTEVAWQPRDTIEIRDKPGSKPSDDTVSQAVSLVGLWGVDVLMFMFMCNRPVDDQKSI